jgi:uncharacterized protein (DUF3084 family)
MLKNLKSLFVEVDSTPAPTGDKSSEKQANNETKTVNPEPLKKVDVANDEIDQVILDKLFHAIEENNQEGFDYLEFRKALQSLSSLPLDESIKFQSAFATASTMGVTLEKLKNSIEFYLKVLQNEEDHFLKASQEQYNVNVEGKAKEKDQINQLILQKSNQIQTLTNEIRQLQTEMEQFSEQIDQADQKIKVTKNSFDKTLAFLRFEFQQDLNKLTQYLK